MRAAGVTLDWRSGGLAAALEPSVEGPVKQRVACAVLTTLAAGLASCGGSSPSTPNPTSPITKGIVLISQTSDGIVSLSPRPGMIRISVPVEVKAMNEIPLTLNYARLTLYRSGAELQRSEVTANEIITQAGSNHVTRDRTLAFTIVFDYTPQQMDAFTMLLSATDANGNTVESALTNLRYVLDPSLG